MKIYCVGGAVRDQLLGRKINERDFVVVGATAEDLIAQGFRPVGKDFPVFLHPETQEEYALARTERKTGKGYTGFECYADPSVTLEEDLERRDLTINAMAQVWDEKDPSGSNNNPIIDPFNGRNDLEKKLFRHVSVAFAEDPVRILRVARLAARFSDFTVHPKTNQLMQKMVQEGEVNALVPERVWKEFYRALNEVDPSRFFSVLKDCGALPILFPELAAHPDSFNYFERSIASASQELPETVSDFKPSEYHPALLHFAALTIPLSSEEISQLCHRLHPPSAFQDLALLVTTQLPNFQSLDIQNPEAIINFLENCDAYRRPHRFFDFCFLANLSMEQSVHEGIIAKTLYKALHLSESIDTQEFIRQGLKGEAIGAAIHQARIEKLKE